MRFMMLMIPKGYEKAQPGAVPDAKAVAAMMKYNQALQKAGVLLALDGLHPPSMGARVTFAGGKPKVTDGPSPRRRRLSADTGSFRSSRRKRRWNGRHAVPVPTMKRSSFARCRKCRTSRPMSRRRRLDFPSCRRSPDGKLHKAVESHTCARLMDAIAIISEEAVKNGSMLGNGGLAPTAQSTRIRISKGQLTVTDGAFTDAKEVIGGYAQFELKSKQEAIDGAVRFMELHRKH